MTLPIELIHNIVFRLNDLTCLALGLGFQHPTLEFEHHIIQQNGGPGHLMTVCLAQQDCDLRILRYLRDRFPNELTPEIALTKAAATGSELAIKRVSLLWHGIRYSNDAWIALAMHHAGWTLASRRIVNWLEARSLADHQIKNVYWILQGQLDSINRSIHKPLARLSLLEQHPDRTWVASRLSDNLLLTLYDQFRDKDEEEDEHADDEDGDNIDNGNRDSSQMTIMLLAAHLGHMSFFEQVLSQDPDTLLQHHRRLIPKMIQGANPVMAIRLVRAFHKDQKDSLLHSEYVNLLRALACKPEYLEDVAFLGKDLTEFRGWDLDLYTMVAREDIETLRTLIQDRRKQREIVLLLVHAKKYHLFRQIGVPEAYPLHTWPPMFYSPSVIRQILEHDQETGLTLESGSMKCMVDWFRRANDDLRVYMLQRGLVTDRVLVLVLGRPIDTRRYIKWSRFLEYSPFIQPEVEMADNDGAPEPAFNLLSTPSTIPDAPPAPQPRRPMETNFYQTCSLNELPPKIVVEGPSVLESCRLIDRIAEAECQILRVHQAASVQQSKAFGFYHDGHCWAPWYHSATASRGQSFLDLMADAAVLVKPAAAQRFEDEQDGGVLAALQATPPPIPQVFHREASSLFFLDPRLPATEVLGQHWHQGRHFHEWFKALDTHLYCLYLENQMNTKTAAAPLSRIL